ncbi:MAG: hypothetical protein WBL51_02225 [Acidimicrobiales bacterium]
MAQVISFDRTFRNQLTRSVRDLTMVLLGPLRDPGIGLQVTSNFDVGYRYRDDVAHNLQTFLQVAVSLRNHVSKALDMRLEDLGQRDELVTDTLGRAFQEHARSGRIALVYALSNVFRHEIIPDTIILTTKYSAPPNPKFEVATSLAMGGLIGGEGWNSASEAYANAHNPVDLLDLANHYGHETRLLVALVVREVRAEYSQRGQR